MIIQLFRPDPEVLTIRVAALPWNQWQLSSGMGGRLALESVADLVWNTRTRRKNLVVHALFLPRLRDKGLIVQQKMWGNLRF